MRLSGLFWSRKVKEPRHVEDICNLFPKLCPSEGKSIPVGSIQASRLNEQTKGTEAEIHRY